MICPLQTVLLIDGHRHHTFHSFTPSLHLALYRYTYTSNKLKIEFCVFFFVCVQENGRSVPDLTASPGRAPPGPMPTNQNAALNQRQTVKEPVLLQGDFRKVSGISSEIFRQIEAVENDHDPSTAAALEVSTLHLIALYFFSLVELTCSGE